ncbi:MAG: hypothetical protein U1F57_11845 [bacterium]
MENLIGPADGALTSFRRHECGADPDGGPSCGVTEHVAPVALRQRA